MCQNQMVLRLCFLFLMIWDIVSWSTAVEIPQHFSLEEAKSVWMQQHDRQTRWWHTVYKYQSPFQPWQSLHYIVQILNRKNYIDHLYSQNQPKKDSIQVLSSFACRDPDFIYVIVGLFCLFDKKQDKISNSDHLCFPLISFRIVFHVFQLFLQCLHVVHSLSILLYQVIPLSLDLPQLLFQRLFRIFIHSFFLPFKHFNNYHQILFNLHKNLIYLQNRTKKCLIFLGFLMGFNEGHILVEKHFIFRDKIRIQDVCNAQNRNFQMIFSYSQFQTTKKKILEEFVKTPSHCLIDEGRLPNEHEYQKIINSILFCRKNKRKTENQMKRLQTLSSNSTRETKRFQKLYQAENSSSRGFYLTEACDTQEQRKDRKTQDQSLNYSPQPMDLDEDKQKLIMLTVETSEQKSKESTYMAEIIELERSLRGIKKKNNFIEEELNRSEQKENKFVSQGLKKQSILNGLTSRNLDFEQTITSTERYFDKSLRNISVTKKSWQKKTAQLTNELVEAILIKAKRKQTVKAQTQQIEKMDEKNKQIKYKLEEFHGLLKKSIHFQTISAIISFIKENAYEKRQKMSQLLDSPPDITKSPEELEKFNFTKNCKDIIKVFKKMKQDANRIEIIFKLKMEEQEELLQIIRDLHSEQEETPKEITVEQEGPETEIEQKIRNKYQKFSKNCQTLVSIEERCQFFVKKEIKCMQKIIQNWLKFDQSAINFVSNIMDCYVSEINYDDDFITYPRLKDIIMNSFENWEVYLPYIEELDQNPLLNRFLEKKKVYSYVSRIIKTKENHPEIPTSFLFEVFLKEFFNERMAETLKQIMHLLKVGVKIYRYSSKYQVLIVNSCVKMDHETRKSTDAGAVEICIGRQDEFQPKSSKVSKKKEKLRNSSGIKDDNQSKLLQLILGYQDDIKNISKSKMSLRMH